MTYMTISINCKILKLLLNYHILDCMSDPAPSSQEPLIISIIGMAGISSSGVRHSGNIAPGQLSEYIEINIGLLRKKKYILS